MAAAVSWVNTYNLTYPVGFDQGGYVYSLFSNGFIPYNVIIDENMKVIFQNSGYNMTTYQTIIDTELNKPPTQPVDFTVVSQNAVSLDLSWTANYQKDVTGYELSVENGLKEERYVIDVGKVTSYTVEGLELQSSYQLQLRAYDYRGNRGPWTDSLDTMTVGYVPALSMGSTILLFAIFTAIFMTVTMRREKSSEKTF